MGGDCVREGGEIVRAHARGRFEAGGELDQGGFAKCGAEKAEAERRAEDDAGRHLHDGISRSGGEPGGTEDKVIAIDQVGGPGRVVGRGDDSVEMELADRPIDTVYARVVIDR